MRSRRGNVAVKLALCSGVLFSLAAFGVDLPYARVVKMELENAAEAAAHAGAAQLDGTDVGIIAADSVARSVGLANWAARTAVAPDSVETGIWDGTAFTPSTDALLANAVRVATSRPSLMLFFSPAAFQRSSVAVGGRAVAVADRGGASSVPCYLPLALPLCQIETWGLDGLQDHDIQLNPPGVDNVSWGRMGETPNTNWTRNQLGNCEASGEAEVDDTVGLQNGIATAALNAMVDAVDASSTTWDAGIFGTQPSPMSGSSISNYGRTLEGTILVFDGGPEYCQGSGGSFTGTSPLVGFVWGVIYDVRNSGSAANRNLKLRIDATDYHTESTEAGGEDWGVLAIEPPRFVAAF